MRKQPISKQFQFVLSAQQTLKNLDELKLQNYDRFVKISKIGKSIQQLSKANLHQQLDQLCTKNFFQIQLLRFEIQDAFISSFNLRNYQITKYYLQNGFDFLKNIEDSVISLAYSLQYLPNPDQAPIQLLELVLQFGANPRYAQSMQSNTALHLACHAGHMKFVKLLVQYGADINAVNDNKQTPLNLAIKDKQNQVIEYLKSLKASQKWNQ